jgi:hypothetical protein
VTANRATDAEYHFYPCAKHVATRMQAEVPNPYCSRIGKRSVQIGWRLFRWFRNSGRRVNKEQEVHERAIFPAGLQPGTRSLRAAGQKVALLDFPAFLSECDRLLAFDEVVSDIKLVRFCATANASTDGG